MYTKPLKYILSVNIKMTVTSSSTHSLLHVRLFGTVKWFNTKTGYGFITVNSGQYGGKDVFTHYSSIVTENPQYRCLYQDEQVTFHMIPSSKPNHEFEAVDVIVMNRVQRNYVNTATVHTDAKPNRANSSTYVNRTNSTKRPTTKKAQPSVVDVDGFTKVTNSKSQP